MTRKTIVILMVSTLPTVAASAQTVAPSAATVVGERLQLSSITGLLADVTAEQAPRQAPSPPPPPPPPPPPDLSPRRRGSMVGYIEDPVVSSKLRVRFDGGWHNPTPDRAEFFYAKCGCYANAPLIGTDVYDPDTPGPGPGAASDVNFQQLFFMGEYAASDHFSVFAELPVRWLKPQAFIPDTGDAFDNQSGLGDIKAGARFGLSAKPGQAITAQVKLFMPTGDASQGLGTNHWSLEPAFLVYRELTPKVAVEGQFAWLAPFDGSAGIPTAGEKKFSGQVISYGIGPSFVVYETGRTRVAPVVELVGWHVIGGFETGGPQPEASSDTVNIKIGGRIAWTPAAQAASASSIYVGYGKALTDAKWYDDILRVEYRLGF